MTEHTEQSTGDFSETATAILRELTRDPRETTEGFINRRIKEETEVLHPSGATSSKKLPYHIVPPAVFERLVRRFAVGKERKGLGAWNYSNPPAVYEARLVDEDFILERVSHLIDHSLKVLVRLHTRQYTAGDDDAGAIMWSGAFLGEALEALQRQADSKKAAAEEPIGDMQSTEYFQEARHDSTEVIRR